MSISHTGCLGENCPICPLLDKPGYEAVRANLTGERLDCGEPIEPIRCIHLGERLTEMVETTVKGAVKLKEKRASVGCRSCNKDREQDRWQLPLYTCPIHDRCTLDKEAGDGTRCCQRCEDFRSSPSFLRRFDETNLFPGATGKRFNPSLIAWKDGYVLAYRDGWKGSEISLVRLTRDFEPIGGAPFKLNLYHPIEAAFGREDPRLFVYQGKLHVMYAGVIGERVFHHTTVLYARISDAFKVEEVFYPHYPKRALWEKNWSPFEHGGQLYVVYSIAPHRIMRIDGNRAEMAYSSPNPFPWSGGQRRGGAAPVRIGDEFYHFFHDRIEDKGHRIYRTGLYTFDAAPPFAPRRYIPGPILTADRPSKPADQYASVVFAGGAVLDGERWVVAHGVHDRWSELHEWLATDLAARLEPVGGNPAAEARFRETLYARIETERAKLEGWCSAEKARHLAATILDRRPALCVEIGVFGGASLIPQALALRPTGGRIVGIDPWDAAACLEGMQTPESRKWWTGLDLAKIREEFFAHVERLDLRGCCEIVEQRSQDVANRFADGSIGLLHLDGNHSQAAALADARLYLPKVAVGGIVYFDDALWQESSTDTAAEAVRWLRAGGCKEIGGVTGCVVLERVR